MQDPYIDNWLEMGVAKYNHGQGKFRHGLLEAPSYAYRLGPYGEGSGLMFYDCHAEWFGYNELEAVGSMSHVWSSSIVYSVLPRAGRI
jgi:hypothetical protein